MPIMFQINFLRAWCFESEITKWITAIIQKLKCMLYVQVMTFLLQALHSAQSMGYTAADAWEVLKSSSALGVYMVISKLTSIITCYKTL